MPLVVERRPENGLERGVDRSFKSREDNELTNPALIDGIVDRISRQIGPEPWRAFKYRPIRIRRFSYRVLDSGNHGHYWPHLDDSRPSTAHRRFAISIDLDDAFSGGELTFPEFATIRYRLAAEAALVFSCSHAPWRAAGHRRTTLSISSVVYDEEALDVHRTDHPTQPDGVRIPDHPKAIGLGRCILL
ncbi:hypothetical protein [Caulobacter sp. S45]|uniref:hypothetical protein n=1 Tax=Caulobacter sp. S45 TaxID=1641861 RepID=UPI00131CD56D|nr:hypothetical protein [Caulobacter sp. S45]